MLITIANDGEPLAADELAIRIGGELPQLEPLAWIVGPQLHNSWMYGRAGAQRLKALVSKIAKAPKDDELVASTSELIAATRWSKALEEYCRTGDPSLFANCSAEGQLLSADVLSPLLRKLGRCTGRIAWRPRALDDGLEVQRYFTEGHDTSLDSENSFSSVQLY